MRNVKIFTIFVFFMLSLWACLFICCKGSNQPVEIDSGHKIVMGTFARVVAIADNQDVANKCIDAAFNEFYSVDNLMSDYKSDSDISKVNRDGFKQAVKVSQSTYEVVQKSIEMSKLSGGAFDITVKPLVELWQKAGETNSTPTQEQLEQTRAKVGYDKLVLDANQMSIRFKTEGMKLDLGAIAKGYAVDKAVEAMKKEGAIGGMASIGGEVRCFGISPKGQGGWLIGIQDPRKSSNNLQNQQSLLKLKMSDCAVSTSGDYNRFVTVANKRHSHIINPNTGQSAEELCSVTIIAKNSADADALATAVSVMGEKEGMKLIESTEDTEAILISCIDNLRIIKSSGAEKYIIGN